MAKIEKNKINLENCSCTSCPTYNECSKKQAEKLFCSEEVGKGKCGYKMNGCICGMCIVHKQMGLKSAYYCIYGSAEKID